MWCSVMPCRAIEDRMSFIIDANYNARHHPRRCHPKARASFYHGTYSYDVSVGVSVCMEHISNIGPMRIAHTRNHAHAWLKTAALVSMLSRTRWMLVLFLLGSMDLKCA